MARPPSAPLGTRDVRWSRRRSGPACLRAIRKAGERQRGSTSSGQAARLRGAGGASRSAPPLSHVLAIRSEPGRNAAGVVYDCRGPLRDRRGHGDGRGSWARDVLRHAFLPQFAGRCRADGAGAQRHLIVARAGGSRGQVASYRDPCPLPERRRARVALGGTRHRPRGGRRVARRAQATRVLLRPDAPQASAFGLPECPPSAATDGSTLRCSPSRQADRPWLA